MDDELGEEIDLNSLWYSLRVSLWYSLRVSLYGSLFSSMRSSLWDGARFGLRVILSGRNRRGR